MPCTAALTAPALRLKNTGERGHCVDKANAAKLADIHCTQHKPCGMPCAQAGAIEREKLTRFAPQLGATSKMGRVVRRS